MTPTEQTPSECKHFHKRSFFAWLLTHLHRCDGSCKIDSCIYESNQQHCPDYQPKEKK